MFHITTFVVILNTQKSLKRIVGQKVGLPCSHVDAVDRRKVSTLPGIEAQFPETLVRTIGIILIYPGSVSIANSFPFSNVTLILERPAEGSSLKYVVYLVNNYKGKALLFLSTIYLWLYSPLLGFCRFFSFLIFYTANRTPWTGIRPIARPLHAHRTAQIQNKRTQTSMPQMGFEPMIRVFERAKTVYVLDRAVTVIGLSTKLRRHMATIDVKSTHYRSCTSGRK
jgi:hypothetical protein